jgi:hypothetical protein
MSLLQMAAQLFLDKTDGSTGLDVGTVGSALNKWAVR